MADKPRFDGERVKLGDLCGVCSGGTPKRSVSEYWNEGSIPWVKISDISGKFVSSTEELITEAGLKGSSAKLLAPGTLLYSIFASIGAVGILKIPAATNQAIAGLSIKTDRIERDYLYHFLKSRESLAKSSGRGAAQNNINLTILRGMEVPVPAIGEQKAIVEQLEIIAAQIKQAETQLDQLDSLVKSRFIEMFGGALSIENKWDSSILENCVESLESGKSPSCKNVSRKGLDPGVLKLSALSSGRFLPGENKAMLDGETIIQAKEVKQGDILVARKNTPQLVGSCVLVREDVTNLMFPDIVFRMHPNDSVNGEYLAALLSSPSYSSKVRGLAHGSNKSMSNIPKSELAKLSIPLPPLSLQQEFADFVAAVDKSRFIAQQQIDKLQTLYDSLAQEYFA